MTSVATISPFSSRTAFIMIISRPELSVTSRVSCAVWGTLTSRKSAVSRCSGRLSENVAPPSRSAATLRAVLHEHTMHRATDTDMIAEVSISACHASYES